jgi:RNA polymerase sigma-70 factor (ECF subfamily)
LSVNEPELVTAARGGDRAAMASLVSVHAPAAQRLALHLARNRADAEDAVQAGFVKAFTHLHQFDIRRPFQPWLLRIVANEVRRMRRDEASRWRFWQSRRVPKSSPETTEATVLVRLEHAALHTAVATLRHDDRLLITLAYFLGQSEAELATTLGVPRGTVKSRKHHALRRLREALGAEWASVRSTPDEQRAEAQAR